MGFFDSHAHYNDEKFLEDKNEILQEIYKSDITKLTCVGYNIESSKKAIQIASENDWVYATCGISPNDTDDFDKIDELKKLVNSPKIVAIGEIGLDYYWNKENKERQKEAFIRQIDIANKNDLPIVIHTRDAFIDTIDILKKHEVKRIGIFHCCPLNQELIKEGLKLGFYISFSGNITFKNAKSAECINLVPLERILIETDSPYLSPEPFRGTRNDSRNVKLVAQKIADVKGVSIEEIAKTTFENAIRIFNIK